MLKDKVIVITGGAGRLGIEFASAVIENGGYAVIADVNDEVGNAAVSSIAEKYNIDRIFFVNLDISSVESLEKLIDSVDSKFKRIDGLVNSAYPRNKNYGRHFFDVEYSDFCENVSMNLGGYFLACQKFSQYFKKQGYGNIVNISSIYGVIAPKFEIYDNTPMTMPVEYAAIKSGLLMLTQYMAKYFRGMNIRVNALSPGGIQDGQPESFLSAYKNVCLNKGMLDKTDISGALVFLLSEMSQYINGQNIIVDDGFSI
ncbi:oxidoreductase [Seleniivibrio woodruffii]|uniref:NAD(P)-dependent dehydrogenase (Short-subunit alcohol dehydrogenase family) n=1 Tax=Seleniivibrio woodruffii TaxID=1078050 RepID=A0A4R1KCW1_9BACT|nr:oxidoreductase [Seleniivibrio woodruffii]TCK62354.1 NAD(P)-dependent dehydrogenase (short-subunit alcohol dehydrogenase family) [Seleniivibrio woodruffii]TVZ34529.1 NAD(P)-dependent dehydrogenase (short-subunit alcohol dehydrogenase family) [Seleniivibrio woodruffii]